MVKRVNRLPLKLRNLRLKPGPLRVRRFYGTHQTVGIRVQKAQHRVNEQWRVLARAAKAETVSLTPMEKSVKSGSLLSYAPCEQVAPFQGLICTWQRLGRELANKGILKRS